MPYVRRAVDVKMQFCAITYSRQRERENDTARLEGGHKKTAISNRSAMRRSLPGPWLAPEIAHGLITYSIGV